MPESAIQRNFAGGELAPALHGRADTVKYATGLRTCRNFFVRKEGGVSNRAGFRYIATAKSGADGLIRLYKWAFTAADDSFLIEAGDFYFRFYQNGAALTVALDTLPEWSGSDEYLQGDLVIFDDVAYYAARDSSAAQPDISPDDWAPLEDDGTDAIYEIPTPYNQGAFDSPGPLRFAQSGALLTITHTNFEPRELQNLTSGDTPRWVLTELASDPSIAEPTGFTWTPGTPGPSGGHTYAYVVTAVKADDYEESLPCSAVIEAGVGQPTVLLPNALSWDAVDGAVEYNVYCDPYANGTYGFIGVATGQTTFNDVGFAPDFEQTPPIARPDLFGTEFNYPEMSAFYQQRRLFGYTDNKPATVWASRTGFRDNFSIRSPLQADDSITFTIESNDLNVLRHLIPLKRLIMLTESGEFVVRGDDGGAITPTDINLDAEGYAGASRAFPAIVGTTVVFVQARGSIVRDLKFTSDISLLETRDLTIYASHLVERKTLARLEYQQQPHSIVWAVRSDGVLLGLTYVPEQDIWGWHRHDTGAAGEFEDICVVPEAGEDVLYAVVKRDINNQTVRYIERLERREIDDANFDRECFFVDAGLTYIGDPVSTIEGLDHLEGQIVAVVADGDVVFDGDPDSEDAASFTVAGGILALPAAASVVHVGLPIRFAELETLDLDVQGSTIRDKRKRIQSIAAIVDRSTHGFLAGPDEDHLIAERAEAWAPSGQTVSERVELNLTCGWGDKGRLLIRHTQPMPLTVLALMPYLEVGG